MRPAKGLLSTRGQSQALANAESVDTESVDAEEGAKPGEVAGSTGVPESEGAQAESWTDTEPEDV